MSSVEHPDQLVARSGGLAAPYISMSDEEAIALARIHFGIRGQVVRLATEKDDTWRLDTDNRHYVLKVSNPCEDASEIAFHCALQHHVTCVDPGIPVPRFILNSNGSMHFNVIDKAGQQRQVRLMTYLQGT